MNGKKKTAWKSPHLQKKHDYPITDSLAKKQISMY